MRIEKGITLVALILTIVVLLILAVVSINAIQDTQIMNYTSNAGQAWNNAQGVENNQVGIYNNYLANYSGTGSTSGGSDSGTTTPRIVTFTIDGTEYTAYEGQTWEQWVDSSANTKYSWTFSYFLDDYVLEDYKKPTTMNPTTEESFVCWAVNYPVERNGNTWHNLVEMEMQIKDGTAYVTLEEEFTS